MRSCEYSGVQGECRTKILCVRNFRFFDRSNRDIQHSMHLLIEATTVSITFEFQKRDIRNDTISYQQSGDILGDGEMCPDRAAIETVTRIYSYGIPVEKVKDTPINFVKLGSLTYIIPSSLILVKIQATVQALGTEKLGFSPNKVGTHLSRSRGAMGMFLAGTPVYTIMLMGRWSSDMFMRYLRKQVISLSHGIASKILTFEEFYTVPDFIHTMADGDPRTRNNTNLAITQNFNGTRKYATWIAPSFPFKSLEDM